MIRVKPLSIVLMGCLLAGGTVGSASAQPWPGRDRNWDQDRDWQGGDWRDRDRGWERDRGDWRGRDGDCRYVRREFRNRYGDIVVRRYRVCED